MSHLLASYLRHAAGKPFVWGECDCCLFAADWIKWKRDVDVMSDLRGTYCSEAGAAGLIASGGGLRALMEARLGPSDYDTSGLNLLAGDVGLVKTAYGETAAIRTGRGWACKTMAGIVTLQIPFIAAWRI